METLAEESDSLQHQIYNNHKTILQIDQVFNA